MENYGLESPEDEENRKPCKYGQPKAQEADAGIFGLDDLLLLDDLCVFLVALGLPPVPFSGDLVGYRLNLGELLLGGGYFLATDARGFLYFQFCFGCLDRLELFVDCREALCDRGSIDGVENAPSAPNNSKAAKKKTIGEEVDVFFQLHVKSKRMAPTRLAIEVQTGLFIAYFCGW